VRGLKSEKQHGIEGGTKWREKDMRNGMVMETRMGMEEVTRFCGLYGFMTTGAPIQPNARPKVAGARTVTAGGANKSAIHWVPE
jgi:hypothetical protein